ncbi:uncharacterized protein LOC135983909 [Chrysemys picta bellii]|uniref:uncharacterized protein LOC135983909 n=1 Tax=Chrysemys picta bellii TaxID=8478 RepID=UPI0032B10D8A
MHSCSHGETMSFTCFHPFRSFTEGTSFSDIDSSSLASPALVHIASGNVCGSPSHLAALPGLIDPGSRLSPASDPRVATPHGMEAPWLNPMELSCSNLVRQVLLASRKPSTRATYLAKWKRFSIWSAQHGSSPMLPSLLLILDYLLHLKQQGLSMSSIMVYLAAISAFHQGAESWSVFANPMVSHFLKGLNRLYPQVRQAVLAWDFNLVLSRLTGLPFESLAICSLPIQGGVSGSNNISQEVSELKALTSEPPYTVFYKDKVQLRPHPAFLPKVVSQFHMNQDIFLPVGYPEPHSSSREQRLHSSDVRRVLTSTSRE